MDWWKSGNVSFVLHRGCNELKIHVREEGSCFSQISGIILKLEKLQVCIPPSPSL